MKYILYIIVGVFLFAGTASASFTPKEGITEDDRGWYIWKEFRIGQNIPYWALQIIQTKTARAEELTLKERIIQHIAYIEDKYKLKRDTLKKVANCESGFNPTALGDKGKAYSVFQFWEKTFTKFKQDADMEELRYKSWEDQTELAGWAFSQGEAYRRHWTCYKKLSAF